MPRSRLTIAQRQRLFLEAQAQKTPAQRETERRIEAAYREMYPMSWDVEGDDAED